MQALTTGVSQLVPLNCAVQLHWYAPLVLSGVQVPPFWHGEVEQPFTGAASQLFPE